MTTLVGDISLQFVFLDKISNDAEIIFRLRKYDIHGAGSLTKLILIN